MPDPTPIPGRVLVVVGTRPEAVKLAPVVLQARIRGELRPVVVATGQHPEMVRQMLDFFDVDVDVDVRLAGCGDRPDLAGATGALQAQLAQVIMDQRVEAVIVQGDTASATAGALAGFYLQRTVHHVEAGLRSGDLSSPFPEEANRRLISVVADAHYAPTDTARAHLLREGIDPGAVLVTGNTGIDALLCARDLVAGTVADDPMLRELLADRHRLVVVTAHRRESWATGLAGIAEGIRRIAERRPGVRFLLPVHRNPAVREVLVPLLSGVSQVVLTEPLGYPDMVRALTRATLVITDSGGIQEEAVTLGVPTLVTRTTTERPEGIAAGGLQLVGADADVITRAAERLLDSASARAAMTCRSMPFGDGNAARSIVEHLVSLSTRSARPRPGTARPVPPPPPVATTRRFEGVSG